MKTERVPAKKVVKKPKNLDPMSSTVASVMTRRVKTVLADTSLESAMDLMMEKEISHLPVVDEEGTLVGILTKTDLVRSFFMEGSTTVERSGDVKLPGKQGVRYGLGQGFHEDTQVVRTVAELMSRRVRTVTDSASVAEAAILMAKYRVHGLPVVSGKNLLVGFVSTMDIVSWVAAS